MHKVVLISTAQPSTNPRLVKEATALVEKGYEVKVLYSYRAKWALEADKTLFKDVKWAHQLIGGSPHKGGMLYQWTRVRRKVAETISFFPQAPQRRFCQAFDELIGAAIKEKADLYIAHNLGALAVAAKVAEKLGVPYAFDAEDFHRQELALSHPISQKIIALEDQFLPGAAYVTAASPKIAKAYNDTYGFPKPVIAINNVFSQKQQPSFRRRKPGNPLRLFWFSQTLGRNRGIQDVLKNLTLLKDIPIQVGLLGNCSEADIVYFSQFFKIPKHRLEILNLRSEKELILLSATYDIGLALERSTPLNRDICLTNKIFTYLLAGNAILASQTKAQQQFMETYPDVGASYPLVQVDHIATVLRQWWEQPEELERQRFAAWNLAKDDLNWEKEQQKFLGLVKSVL